MNIQDYIEREQFLYKEFSLAVADILVSLIGDNQYGVQQIQHRAKTAKSLAIKLKDRGIYHFNNIENEIKDLAGCRVIFYHNDDLNSLLTSSFLSDNFEVDWDASKFHHPDSDAASANDYYIANHFMVSLTSDQLRQSEFSKFKGLKCEIQVQTLLNHAWAETVHNITYKQRESGGFGDRLMKSIDERLMTIMTEHLRPAGYEFQKAKRDYSQFVQGQEIFDSDFKKAIEDAEDNNVLHGLLERYKNYVLPNYTDYDSYADEIYEIINISLSNSRDTDVVDIEVLNSSINGKSYNDILSSCLEILDFIRYLDLERTHNLFVKIHPTLVDNSIEETYVKYVERFANYSFDAVNQGGFYIQEYLLKKLMEITQEELFQLSEYVFPICKAILQPSFEKTESTHNQITIGTINHIGDEALANLRQNTIGFLKTLNACQDVSTRVRVKTCLDVATRSPHRGECSDDLMQIILSNSNEFIRIYMSEIDSQNFQEIQECEERIHSLYQRAKQLLTHKAKHQDLKDTATITIELVVQYRANLIANDDYQKYIVLVGFRSVFDQEWDDARWGYKEKEAFRDQRILEYVDSIDDGSYIDWVRILSVCSKTDSSDLATFQYFQKFLTLLANNKPELALKLINDGDAGLERFLTSFLLGFADSGRAEIIDAVIDKHLKDGDDLWECARLFVLKQNVDRSYLSKLFEVAKQQDHVPAMIQLIAAVVANGENDSDELSTIFLPIIEELTKRNVTSWVHEVYFKSQINTLLGSLSKDQAAILLENIVLLPEIDYHAEQVIKPIAAKYLTEVIEFFGNRLKIESHKERGDRYDAIPFDFQELSEQLSASPEELIDIVLVWYNTDSSLFQYRGGNFVSIVFPQFNERLEAKLIDLIKTKGGEILDFVTSILRNYKGEVFLHQVCKEIIMILPAESEFISEVRIILQESGVIRGEFGFVELSEQKKGEIIHWLEDENPKVKNFAETYVNSLDRQRAAEQKRAEDDLEMRKRNYGV